MKKTSMAAIFAVSLFALTACAAGGSQNHISNELGLDISAGEEISRYDTHSGNGDGVTCIAFRFEDDAVRKEIQGRAEWHAFPLDETVQALAYGVSDEASQTGPFLTDEDGKPLVPEIRNGYYLLIDRQAEKGMIEAADILHRHSFNFTLGLYDTDADTLYFCKLDT